MAGPCRHLSAIVFSLIVAGIALAPSPALGDATPPLPIGAAVPFHDLGDATSFGASLDLNRIAENFLATVRHDDELDEDVSIHELNLVGSADIWFVAQIVDEDETVYSVQEDAAVGVRLFFVVDFTSNRFPVSGVYPGTKGPNGQCATPSTFPTAERRASLSVQREYLLTSSGRSAWNVSDFALRERSMVHHFEVRSTSSIQGIPAYVIDRDACEVTIAYRDQDRQVSGVADAEVRVAYEPSFDFFEFPIQGEMWFAVADSTVTGSITGNIEVQGMDSAMEVEHLVIAREAFARVGMDVGGLIGLPMVLVDDPVAIGAVYKHETAEIPGGSVRVFNALFAEEVQNLDLRTFYRIIDASAPGFPFVACGWVYDPDRGFIVGYSCEVDDVDIDWQLFELRGVLGSTAKQEIENTKARYTLSVVPGNPAADFFLRPPFPGMVLLAAIGIAVAFVAGRRRKAKVMRVATELLVEPPSTGPPPPSP
jgi:hypothetical protein